MLNLEEALKQLVDVLNDEELYRMRVRAKKRSFGPLVELMTKEIELREALHNRASKEGLK